MHDIKTKDVLQNTIKTVDRTALAGQRMKDAYIQTKHKAEHSVYSSESNTEEYAADQMTDAAFNVTHEAVHQVDVQGQKIIQGARQKLQQRQAQKAQQPTQDSPQPSPDAPAPDAPQPVQNSNIPQASQPHRVSPDGAVTKQEAIRSKQIASAKADLKAKRASQQITPSASKIPQANDIPTTPSQRKVPGSVHTPAAKTIKTVERTGEAIKQTARSAGRATIKAPGKTIKTASSTVKSVEQVGSASVKTAQATFKAAQKAAIESAKAAQRIRAAAKATATTVKALAAAASKAVKAIIAAVQELITAIAAGGWVALLVIVLVVMCFAGMMFASDEDDTEILPVTEEVKAYEPIIQQYAREHGIGDYVLLIQAVMMQESGGRGTDPMQASECGYNTLYPHAPGSIRDPEYSINVGIQNLADCLSVAQCESPMDMDAIKLALQGYNYGQGYITWAMNKYGEYSKANAVEFSINAAERYGWSSYGDMNYVPHVLRYYPLGQIFYDPDTSTLIVEVARSQIGNVGGEPYWSWYGFTERVEWCACFVSWCANKCRYIDSGIIPKFSGCINGVEWFKDRRQWIGNSFEPSPGMIIFFDWDDEDGQDGNADHVGIVEKVENGRVYTIEGNTSDSCRQRSYPVGYYQILGYGVPDY
ncbi:MAG: lysozyme family protein [Oscillospiraceae bacterium]|nr:lysozyme family protein [Oscillospiraceae bacterium]